MQSGLAAELAVLQKKGNFKKKEKKLDIPTLLCKDFFCLISKFYVGSKRTLMLIPVS